jgi:hypothetical protein
MRRFIETLKNIEGRDVTRLLLDIIIALIANWPLLLLTALLFVISYFWVEIDPERVYGFGAAMLHGLFWTQNAILYVFTGRETRAPLNTGGWYMAGFIIGLVAIPMLIRVIIEIMGVLLAEIGFSQRKFQELLSELFNRW